MSFRQVLAKALFWIFCSQLIPCVVLTYLWANRWRKAGMRQEQKMLFYIFLSVGLLVGSFLAFVGVRQSLVTLRWIFFWLMMVALAFETAVMWRSMVYMMGFDDLRSFLLFIVDELRRILRRKH